MVVNDDAGKQDKRGALESIAGKPAPTGSASSGFPGIDAVLVGAGLPAMVVNDYAGKQDKRGALESIAGKPAPTSVALLVFPPTVMIEPDFKARHVPLCPSSRLQ
jgi:hypothetical protein